MDERTKEIQTSITEKSTTAITIIERTLESQKETNSKITEERLVEIERQMTDISNQQDSSADLKEVVESMSEDMSKVTIVVKEAKEQRTQNTQAITSLKEKLEQ